MLPRRVPMPLPGRLVVTVVAHSRAYERMRACRVPALLPGQLSVTVVHHSRACACMRARRVPAPLPGRPTAARAAHRGRGGAQQCLRAHARSQDTRTAAGAAHRGRGGAQHIPSMTLTPPTPVQVVMRLRHAAGREACCGTESAGAPRTTGATAALSRTALAGAC